MSDSSKPIPEDNQDESSPIESSSPSVDEQIHTAEFSEEQIEISQLQEELKEANDRALRVQAELENYRKRMQREMDEGRRYANVSLIRDLLPIIDNLGRAISSAEKTEENAGLLTGVEMVVEQFFSILSQHHCKKIESDGELFDPNLHEAISQQYSDQHPENTILLEALSGYTIHDRVVRPSQVVVSTIQPPGDVNKSSDEDEYAAE